MSLQRDSRGPGRIWTFGEFEYDELRLQLSSRKALVELEMKPLEILRQLLLRNGEVVTKQELLDAVWPGLLVVDGSIATAVSKLRKALNDQDARIVVTIARVGYRLAVPVESRSEGFATSSDSAQHHEFKARSGQPLSDARRKPLSIGWQFALAAAALVAAALIDFGLVRHRSNRPLPRAHSVAVLPFQNAGSDPDLDFLSVALADEVTTELSNIRSLSVRPFTTTSKFSASASDPQKAGGALNVASIVTGHFLKEGGQFRITLEAINVGDNRILWRDTLTVPAGNMIAMRNELVERTRGDLAAVLGVPRSLSGTETRPLNNEAYDLYLRSLSFASDPEPSRQASAMLEKSVALDPTFAPAWLMLSKRYYVESRYAGGSNEAMSRFEAALERSRSLDPNYIAASAGLIAYHTEQGKLTKALQEAQDLVRRRPDSADAHYSLSYALRYAGLLEKAATHCDIALLLDPHTKSSGLRSCAVVFILGGNYARAMDYLRLDSEGSAFRKALSLHIFLRAGKVTEAMRVGPSGIPQWRSFDMLLACAEHRSASDIASLAEGVKPADDPETNYFAASHFAYCGNSSAALGLLRQSIRGGYCSYPALDVDPFFSRLRDTAEFAESRKSAIRCQAKLLVEAGAARPMRR